jgi:hypothetical protein
MPFFAGDVDEVSVTVNLFESFVGMSEERRVGFLKRLERTFFARARVLSVGERVTLPVPVADGQKPVSVMGEIVKPGPRGVGLKFISIEYMGLKLNLHGLRTGIEYPTDNGLQVIDVTRTKKTKIRWIPPACSDLSGYRLYWADKGAIGYHSEFAEVGAVTEVILPDDIAAFPLVSGDMDIGVTAVDQLGNESDMITFSACFDFGLCNNLPEEGLEQAQKTFAQRATSERFRQGHISTSL